MRRLYNPALVLFFLAPAIGELLSGSAPPLQFFNPPSFVILTVLYGGSAVLVRELTMRWNKGWITILVLGLAFGILNEGVIAKSFFDPHWKDLGPLAGYGRVFDVNWVWTVQLLIYHAVISIAIPIALTNLLFPSKQNQVWLSKKMFAVVLIALIIDSLFGFLFINQYQPNPFVFPLFVVEMFLLIVVAKFLPKQLTPPLHSQPKAAKWFFILGFLFNVFLFFMTDALAQNRISPLVNIFAILGINFIFALLFVKLSGNGYALGDRQKWGFIAGVLSLFILLSFVHETLGGRIGMSVVGVFFAILLFWLYKKIKKRSQL